MNWKAILQTLAAAAIGGAANGATTVVTTTGKVQGTSVGIGAGVGAILSVLGLIVKSPWFQPQQLPAPVAEVPVPKQ